MGDHEIAHRIHRHPIGPDAAGKIRENADLGDAAIGRQWHAPNAVAAGGGDQQQIFGGVEHQAIRARHIVEQAGQLAIGRIAIHMSHRIVHAGVALVGEINIAIGCEN